MEAPLITVIIAVYNGARYLAAAIESALAQTYEAVEIVVVDDGSEDGSGAIAEKFLPRVRYARHPHEGMGAARNRAIALARGSLFAFLDADDAFPAGRLELQISAFRADPALEAVYGHVREFVSADLEPAAARRLRTPAARIQGRLVGAVLIKREAFFRVGLFDTTLKVGVGLDWSARAAEQRLKSLILPEIVLERRLHNENNGLRQKDHRDQYIHVIKAALDRRRGQKLP